MRCCSKFLPIVFISLLPFMLFWRWVWYGEVLFWGTLLLQFWPWHHLVTNSLLRGQWPLWNPLLGNGAPLLANLQSAVFYPVNIIFLLMSTAHALTFSIVVHLMLAGLLMYCYGRRLGLSAFAATVSGLVFMFCGYLIGRTQFIVMIQTAAWVPLLLLFSENMVTRQRLLDVLLLAVVLSMQFLAGHAQLWFYGLWLIGAYTVFRSWQAARERKNIEPNKRMKVILRSTAGLTLAVIIAVLLSAAQILPTAELVAQSPRGEGAETNFALTYSFWPWRLITLITPNFFGNPADGDYWGYGNYWEDHAYTGVLPFIFGLIAVWRYLKLRFKGWRIPQVESLAYDQFPSLRFVPFFAILVPVSLILALGWNTPVYLWVFENIPGFGFFQAPARLLIWYSIAMAVLAGIGAEVFASTPQNRPNWRRFLAACVALTIAGLAGETFLTGRELTFLPASRELGGLLIISVILLLIRPNRRQTEWYKETSWQGIVAAFIALDLMLAARPLIPTTSAEVFDQAIESASVIQSQPGDHRFFVDEEFAYTTIFTRYFRFETFGRLDTEYWQQFKEFLVPNFGVFATLPSANNNDPLPVGHYRLLTNLLRTANPGEQARLLSLMNVGYLLDDSTTNTTWSVIYKDEAFEVQRVPEPLPHAYFVTRAQFATNRSEAIATIIDPDFDSHQEVVIMKHDDDELTRGTSTAPVGPVPVSIVEQELNQIQLQVDAPAAGFVVLTDTYYPGWQATVNDQTAPVMQANLAFRAVAVEPGLNKITFIYRPRAFAAGLWVSAVACLMVTIVIIFLHTEAVKNRFRKFITNLKQ